MVAQDFREIVAKVAHRIRAIVVKETVPFKTGELRKSIHVTRWGDGWMVGTNKIYARAVHEGRPGMIIRPRRKKALFWNGAAHPSRKVFSPRRAGRPFLRDAIDSFERNLSTETQDLGLDDAMAAALARSLRAKGLSVEIKG